MGDLITVTASALDWLSVLRAIEEYIEGCPRPGECATCERLHRAAVEIEEQLK